MVAISSFIQAKWYGVTRDTSKIRLIVVHSMEAPEGPQTAENVANYFKDGAEGRKASAHYNVDADSIVQSVRDDVVAFHAPGANSDGIGIEHAGYMRQSREDWLDSYSLSMLNLSARLAADLAIKYHIPVRHLTNAELLSGNKGFVAHSQVSDVYKRSDHGDPGAGFPWDVYLNMVSSYMHQATPGTPPVVSTPDKLEFNKRFGYPKEWAIPYKTKKLQLGATGEDVTKLQKFLRALNYRDEQGNEVAINGNYTRNTGFPIGYRQRQRHEPETWFADYPWEVRDLGEYLISQLLKLYDANTVLSAGISALPAIYHWQCFLRLHNPKLACDWKFGKTTLAWTRQFQKDNGLKVDGIVGRQTLTAACYSIVNIILQ